jgi:predicted nucleic acid-binding protein
MPRASLVRVLPVTHELVVAAVILRRRYHISHWDSTIIAAAQELGCKTLYSEDLNHGQDYDGVRIQNPFRSAAD